MYTFWVLSSVCWCACKCVGDSGQGVDELGRYKCEFNPTHPVPRKPTRQDRRLKVPPELGRRPQQPGVGEVTHRKELKRRAGRLVYWIRLGLPIRQAPAWAANSKIANSNQQSLSQPASQPANRQPTDLVQVVLHRRPRQQHPPGALDPRERPVGEGLVVLEAVGLFFWGGGGGCGQDFELSCVRQ
jgi:hypothetical protein